MEVSWGVFHWKIRAFAEKRFENVYGSRKKNRFAEIGKNHKGRCRKISQNLCGKIGGNV